MKSGAGFIFSLILAFIAGAVVAYALVLDANADKTKSVPYVNGSSIPVFVRGDRWFITVGDHDVDSLLNNMNAFGVTHCSDRQIYVLGNMTISNQRDTLFHELLHAGTCDLAGEVHNEYYNSTFTGQAGIPKISQYTTSLFHDNPELARFVIGQ